MRLSKERHRARESWAHALRKHHVGGQGWRWVVWLVSRRARPCEQHRRRRCILSVYDFFNQRQSACTGSGQSPRAGFVFIRFSAQRRLNRVRTPVCSRQR